MNTAIIWPLCFLLVALLALHHVREPVRPIIAGIVSGLTKHATANAPAYAIAIGFGLSASLASFIDVFQTMTSDKIAALSYHQYGALVAKCLNPFIVAILAYATQSRFKSGATPTDTQPPFKP